MLYAINQCFGGFGLSQEACEWLINNKGWKVADHVDGNNLYHSDCLKLINEGYHFYKLLGESLIGPLCLLLKKDSLEFRSNPDVIECIQALGHKANGRHAQIELIECDLPPSQLEIDEYDGQETLQTIPQRFG